MSENTKEQGCGGETLPGYDTPMMRQHSQMKSEHPNTFLFFRCGDFYELFGRDAIEAARILDITLTKRQNEIPMCGVPYHAVDVYIHRMMSAGCKVAICEQLEDPKSVKGLVKRGVTDIITPGTIIDESHLSNKFNNFLLAINIKGLWIELAYLDLSTGEFELSEVELTPDLGALKSELSRISPKEIVVSQQLLDYSPSASELFCETENILVNRYPATFFDVDKTKAVLLEHFKVESIRNLGLLESKTDVSTPGALLCYLKQNCKSSLGHIRRLRYHSCESVMRLDESTIKHLEILRNQNDGTVVNSLLDTIDKTVTSMGGRLLKKWLVEPLLSKEQIDSRLDAVECFVQDAQLLCGVDSSIKNIVDLERLATRLVMDKATPKDLVAIKNSLRECARVKELLLPVEKLDSWATTLQPLGVLSQMIDERIKDEPATFIDDGNIVRDGYSEELDELKALASESREYITRIEADIKQRYGVSTLKIKYNKILGYFFEVSKNQSVNLDDSFITRQSLVNNIRYTNKELSEYESKVLTAKDRINSLEREIFLEVKDQALLHLGAILDNAKSISQLDVIASFAKVSTQFSYIRPEISEDYSISIEDGRHPVVETKLDYNEFIPNDTQMSDENYLMIITGPNMAGKSTYLRQNALIVLLAQIGCFVPARSATVGVVDRIFTRIGTSDNLARGESTFFVEMQETANILNHATGRSLIIMDEIGRGTSTYDGLAIAWSILEYIQNKKLIGAKTLFATHYHELTHLESREGVKNYSVAVSEENEQVTFLHKIVAKPAGRSYGIHVAELAGLPEPVISYAKELLEQLESKRESGEPASTQQTCEQPLVQQNLFEFDAEQKSDRKSKELLNQIEYLDLDRMTPIQAMNMLYDLQKKVKKLK